MELSALAFSVLRTLETRKSIVVVAMNSMYSYCQVLFWCNLNDVWVEDFSLMHDSFTGDIRALFNVQNVSLSVMIDR